MDSMCIVMTYMDTLTYLTRGRSGAIHVLSVTLTYANIYSDERVVDRVVIHGQYASGFSPENFVSVVKSNTHVVSPLGWSPENMYC